MKIAFLKTLMLAATVGFGVTGAASAAMLSHTVDEATTPDYLDGSPLLAKCNTETDNLDSFPLNCDVWEDGVAPGNYASAFTLIYQSESLFFWSFDAGDVTGADPVLFPTKIAVGHGTGYEVWLLDVTELDNMAGNISSNFADISHVSFYDTEVHSVPEPAVGWLLLAGMGALAVRRRKKF